MRGDTTETFVQVGCPQSFSDRSNPIFRASLSEWGIFSTFRVNRIKKPETTETKMKQSKKILKSMDEMGKRKLGEDRRKNVESSKAPAVERRQGSRRRQIDPTTCEREYTDQEVEFMHAMDEYKRNSGRMFPTCSEILEVMSKLGYRKVADAEAVYQPQSAR